MRTNKTEGLEQVSSAAPPGVSPSGHPSDSGGNPFKQIEAVPGAASVLNSCPYPVYIKSDGHISCEGSQEVQLVAPQSVYTEDLRTCKDGGISLKISKTPDMQAPMQFEYSVWPDNKMVSYDMSFLSCLKNDHDEKDLRACAGQEHGMQTVGGTQADEHCATYFCRPGEWCDKQAYVVKEFDYRPGAPVGACTVDKGVAWELCAGNR